MACIIGYGLSSIGKNFHGLNILDNNKSELKINSTYA